MTYQHFAPWTDAEIRELADYQSCGRRVAEGISSVFESRGRKWTDPAMVFDPA